MSLTPIWTALEAAPFAKAIRSNGLLFPWIESVHVLAIVLVVGTISIVDLRLLGWRSADRPVTWTAGQVLPYTWGAFVVAVTTGFLLFSSSATTYAVNWPFRLKMLCLAAAGVNMAVFHLTGYRSVRWWDERRQPPFAAKLQGGLSLCFWIGVVAFGRWIGFTSN